MYLCLHSYDYFVWLSGVMGLTQLRPVTSTQDLVQGKIKGPDSWDCFLFKRREKSWRLRNFLEERLLREKLTNSRWAWVSEFIDWDEVVKSNVKTNKSQLGRLELSSSRKLKLKWTIPLIQLLTFIFSLSRTILTVEYKTNHGFSNLCYWSTIWNVRIC